MARKKNDWTASLHPRDRRGRFKGAKARNARAGRQRPSRGKRIKRGSATLGQALIGSNVGSLIGLGLAGPAGITAGAVVGAAVAHHRRRNSQLRRKEVGLRSALFPYRRLT